ncbi:MAG: succinylglutamate desuccinylase [Gammaproteobacteria bacterium]|nr:succinylglutamate desuccinylase [Gammaproteobacteria bacterium]
MQVEPLNINGQSIAPGTRTTLELPITRLYTHTPITMPVQIVRGNKGGPHLFVSAAIHGDELNGVEIIRRVLRSAALRRLRGTLIAVPIVNVQGFLQHSRELPDQRDLNRVFPGSEKGSLAARLAHTFMEEIVGNATHGIDLHTGARHRFNLPHIRANMHLPDTEAMAKAFGTPVVLNSDIRDGSLRQAATEARIPALVYEAGEALRFDEVSIRAGVRGVINVMRFLGMLPPSTRRKKRPHAEPVIAESSAWVRAPGSGILRPLIGLGARVRKGDVLGIVSDPFGSQEREIKSTYAGIVIGRTHLPMAYEGEALFHIARFETVEDVAAQVEAFQATYQMEESHPGTATFNDEPEPSPNE